MCIKYAKILKIEICFTTIWWKIFFRPLINLHSCLLKVNNDHANCDIIGNELFNSRQTGKNKANEEINFTVQKIFNTQQKWSPTWQRKIRHGIINILPSSDVLRKKGKYIFKYVRETVDNHSIFVVTIWFLITNR